MGRRIGSKIMPDTFDDLFDGGLISTNEIKEIPVDMLHDFKDHPFRVERDEKMEETIASIKEKGILTPGLVRPLPEGGYEIISGHRRTFAARELGLPTVPMIIREMTDEEATVAMVDANIQREDIRPSEKAKSYRMKYEKVKGKHNDQKGNNLDQLGAAAGESGKTVQRYLALSYLIPDLLDMVDEKKIGLRQGVDLSALDEKSQILLSGILSGRKGSLTMDQTSKIKECYREGSLSKAEILRILSGEKKKPRNVTIKEDKLKKYFREGTSEEEMETLIFQLLDKWKEEGGE